MSQVDGSHPDCDGDPIDEQAAASSGEGPLHPWPAPIRGHLVDPPGQFFCGACLTEIGGNRAPVRWWPDSSSSPAPFG